MCIFGVKIFSNKLDSELFFISEINSAASILALKSHSWHIAIESSPADVRSINSCDMLPPIIPESDATETTSGIPVLSNIRLYALKHLS